MVLRFTSLGLYHFRTWSCGVAASVLSIVVLQGCWASLLAQDSPPLPLPSSPLSIRQQRVERLVKELEQKFKSLTLAIQEKEPERAERLQHALNKARELLLERRMAEVTRLLDQSQFDSASDGQKVLITDLRELLGLLLNDRSGVRDTQAQMDLLKQWKKELQRLTLIQKDEKLRSELVAAQQLQKSGPPRSKFEELNRQQQAIADQARELAAKMKQAGQASWPDGEARPGEASLSAAEQSMLQAGGKLDKQDAGAAAAQQQRALEQLDAAQSEIDAALSELNEQAQSAALLDVEKLLVEMLAAQRLLTQQTTALNQKRLATGDQITRADRNAIRIVGDDERRLQSLATADGVKEPGLAGKARLAAEMLTGGPATGLAAPLNELAERLLAVGDLIANDLRTDAKVASRQSDIEIKLETLLTFVKKLQSEKRQQSNSSQAAGGNQSAASGSDAKQSQQAAQGGKQGGGSKGIDTGASVETGTPLPQNPWTQLRDKERDPVFTAIKEKFPARYQQLIEQYYRSFGDNPQK